MTVEWIDTINTAASVLLFFIGLGGLLLQRRVVRQVFSLKIMLQGVTLGLIQAGRMHEDLRFAQSMVISALIVEAVVIAVALALIVNVFRHYPSGDVDHLNRLRG
ncbi:MAG TPA: NADH-quinone oxidoreductase subunit NuoK [Anaerolineae bacterium]|nr:NADH-quinone oxidoreductase subunit NuoK [Anaerolineae bacterium]HQI83009.1 NADH-quinone oxidoreductase subunit NuoK [Anaerolineae bacterium]